MKLEETTFFQLKPGDLFFYPGDQATSGVQVRTGSFGTLDEGYGTFVEGDAKVIRIVDDVHERSISDDEDDKEAVTLS